MISERNLSSSYLEYKTLVKILKDLKTTLEYLERRVDSIDDRLRKLELSRSELDKLQTLSEKIETLSFLVKDLRKKFDEEVEDGETIVNRIVTEIKSLLPRWELKVEERLDGKELTIVERKRINEILKLLKEHEKLTSSQLSEMLGLSRTRCNEYFKLMERLGMVEPILMGKEKFYALKTNQTIA